MSIDTRDPYHVAHEAYRVISRDLAEGDSLSLRAKSLYGSAAYAVNMTPAYNRTSYFYMNYLPKEAGENDQSYINRLNRTFYFNAYSEAVSKTIGKVFDKELRLADDVTNLAVIQMAEDIDFCGNHLQVFANQFLKDFILDGVNYFLVDYPDTSDAQVRVRQEGREWSKQDEINLNARPFFTRYSADQVYSIDYDIIDGRKVLTQVRIRCVETVKVDEFTRKDADYIYVLDLYNGKYRIRKFAKDKYGGWELMDGKERITHLDYIPLIIMSNHSNPFMSKPVYMSLADKTIQLYQMQSDFTNLVHVSCVPLLNIVGYSQEELFGDANDSNTTPALNIGMGRAFVSSNPDAKTFYTEAKGDSLEQARLAIESIKHEMQFLGLPELLTRPTGSETATARALDQAESDTRLTMMATSLKDCIENGLKMAGDWLGMSYDSVGSIIMNTTFNELDK